MLENLSQAVIKTIKLAAKLLTGVKRRRYIAEVTLEFLDGSARKAERMFGWGRETVHKGLKEYETGIECQDNYSGRGNKCTEDKNPKLEKDIRDLIEPQSQTDPDFKASFRYTRITAEEVRKALIEEKGWISEDLPAISTLREMLNRMGYKLRKVQKSKPQKKIPETDEIFKNTTKINKEADEDAETVRISVDVKAKVKIGESSRGGKSRGSSAEQASDHDMVVEAKLVPVGILEPVSGASTIYFGTSIETTDLIVDCLEMWWEDNKEGHTGIKKLVINLDNGPHVQSHRTQFIKRITEFSQQTGLIIHLVYYPPYHSKYNPVERLWGILENKWNGTILNSVGKALKWAKKMTWKGIKPAIHLLDTIYKTGITLTAKEMKKYEETILRSEKLSRWDVLISPQNG